jgi:hypothetical protein
MSLSVKLVNYAQNDNGKLKLFTELSHTFNVDDTIYIIGGHYDNTSELLNVTDFSVLTPYIHNPFLAGYKVISVDYANNSFTIDYDTTDLTLIYPYGEVNNRFGDSQDNINLSYNNDINRFSYASKNVFLSGDMRQGTISDGIFGNDNNTAELNSYNVNNQTTITHIISKNVNLHKGTIASKVITTNSPSSSNKLVVSEDLSVNVNNPHTYTIQPNSDHRFGYSIFERFKHINEVSITGGDFSNCGNGQIILKSNAVIQKTLIGGLHQKSYLDLQQNNISLSRIHNTDNYTDMTFNQCDHLTGIPLYGTGILFTANAGEVIFDVAYDSVYNKNWQIGGNVYVNGINIPNQTKHEYINQIFGTLTAVNYTFGDQTSAKITMQMNYTGPWSTIQAYNTASLDVSELTLFPEHTGQNSIIYNNNSNVSLYMNSLNADKVFINDNCVLKTGYYNNLTLSNLSNISGTSYGLSVVTKKLYQIIKQGSTQIISYLYNKYETDNDTYLSGKIYNSTLYGLVITNSYIYSSYLNGVGLYDCTVNNGTVGINVKYQKVNITFTSGVVADANNNFVEVASLNGRTSPEITYIDTGDTSYNLNTVTTHSYDPVWDTYNSQKILHENIGPTVTTYTYDYEVPNQIRMINPIPPFTTPEPSFGNTDMLLIEKNVVEWSPSGSNGVWNPIYNTNKIMYNPYFNDPSTNILPELDNKKNDIVSNTYTTFAGASETPGQIYNQNLIHVDDNFVVTQKLPYAKNTTDNTINRTPINIVSVRFHNMFDVDTLPEPTTTNMDNAFQLYKMYGVNTQLTLGGNSIYTIHETIKLGFKLDKTQLFGANNTVVTNVMNPIIEIEYITIKSTNVNTNVVTTNVIYCNYIPDLTSGDKFSSISTTPVSQHVAVVQINQIYDNNNNVVTIDLNVDEIVEVDVVYWTTFRASSYKFDSNDNQEIPGINERTRIVFGAKEKNNFNCTFTYNTPPALMVNSTDTLIDGANNTIVA